MLPGEEILIESFIFAVFLKTFRLFKKKET